MIYIQDTTGDEWDSGKDKGQVFPKETSTSWSVTRNIINRWIEDTQFNFIF